ncbi:MAG: hypothetical protein ACAI43_18300 [Phycisphaerae bacterium]|nr:hypothetical protein [Tepidisphaeraceae bacterium]
MSPQLALVPIEDVYHLYVHDLAPQTAEVRDGPRVTIEIERPFVE